MTTRARRILAAVVLAVTATLTIVPTGTAGAETSTDTIRITGTVSDRGGYPLAGVIVGVVRADREDSDFEEVRTGVKGDFVTPDIPVDANMNYQLVVTDPTGAPPDRLPKEFAATTANSLQNVTMADAAIIRGKVTTKDGDVVRPATHVLVEAYGTDRRGQPAGGIAFTSAEGAFSMGGLPSGTYLLTFVDYDEDGTREGPLFRTICYDNVPLTSVEPDRCDGATPVKVTAGKVTTLNPQVLDQRLG